MSEALLDCAIAGSRGKDEPYEVACDRALASGAELMGHPEVLRPPREDLAQVEWTA